MSTTEARAHVCTQPQTPIEYLNSLPEWDGVPRLDTWLPQALGRTVEYAGEQHMAYLGLVGYFWLQGMLYRAQEGGSKFEHCIVLEGRGGTRKSALLQVLAGEGLHSDCAFDAGWGRAAKEQLKGVWLYEIAELAAFSNSDMAAVKAFILAHSDVYRPNYSQSMEYFPRRFVLAATTDGPSWRAAGIPRHFWPVPVPHPVNIEWVRTHRDQLFAEAKARMQEAGAMPDLHAHPGAPDGRSGRLQ